MTGPEEEDKASDDGIAAATALLFPLPLGDAAAAEEVVEVVDEGAGVALPPDTLNTSTMRGFRLMEPNTKLRGRLGSQHA